MAVLLPGRRAVVGGVKPFTLENNTYRLVDLAQRNRIAIGANGEGIIGEMLELIEMIITILAFITVNWHFLLTSPVQESLSYHRMV